MIVKWKLKWTRKEIVMALFKALFQNIPGGTEEKMKPLG
jgi:hypothetical protein